MTREEFERSGAKLIKSEREGSGPMAMNAKDTYVTEDGRVIVHTWAMGGESFEEKPR